jgi:2-keto-3-deoxy-L-rhamnonate aldolase RhmA
VPEIRRDCFLTPLELGAAGVVVPRVESRAQAEAVIRLCHYPPLGERGVSLSRAHTGFRRVKPDQYLAEANAAILVAVQIETAAALDALDDIVSVPGIDMLFIGPSDLSVSCGISAELNDPDMADTINRILSAARRHGRHVGLQTTDIASAKSLVANGLNFISCATDLSALSNGLRSNLIALEDIATRRA